MDPVTASILVALIGAVSLVTSTVISGRKTRAAVAAVHTEVATNHGKPARAYLEMVADVKTTVDLVAAGQQSIVQLIADHTLQDTVNFDALRREMQTIRGQVVAGNTAGAVAAASAEARSHPIEAKLDVTLGS